MDADPVVRRRRVQEAPEPDHKRRRGGSTKAGSAKPRSAKAGTPKVKTKQAGDAKGRSRSGSSPTRTTARGSDEGASGGGAAAAVTNFLVRPDTEGHKVKLGLAWFAAAVGSLLLGRWAITLLWATVSCAAAWQLARVWSAPGSSHATPAWSPTLAAVAAGTMVAAAGVGTSLAGIALIVVPLVAVGVVMVAGRKPAAAGAALIGAVLAAIPAVSVVLVSRTETWAALFLVAAVSFYDAGYFIGAAESSSRLEGPVTGGIGLLAVTFTASAFEAPPFDRATAWIAGLLMLAACPLGQMLTSAELPYPSENVPAMRRLDSYLVAAPLMLLAVWTLG